MGDSKPYLKGSYFTKIAKNFYFSANTYADTMNLMDLSLTLEVLKPELFILIGIFLTVIFSFGEKTKEYTSGIASASLLIAALLLFQDVAVGKENSYVLFDAFKADSLSTYFRLLIYSVTFLISLASSDYLKVIESPAEFSPILLTASLGAGVLVSANDFLLVFVALETLGLSAIIMSSYARLNQSSNEAGIKYLINSALASSIFLLGISFIYGLTGFTNFDLIGQKMDQLLVSGAISDGIRILFSVCIIAAIAFKLAAAPFHNWSPDVYTGAPTVTTLFLSVVSKIAAFGLAIRLINNIFVGNDIFAILFAWVAIFSIVIGNYIGVTQILSRSSIKRLLAYSSIAQGGYLIIALSIFKPDTIVALTMYLSVYAIMNTGAFLCAIYFEQITQSDKIYDLAGLIHKKPLLTIIFSLCLINLAGLPFIPAGFITKFFLFLTVYSSGAYMAHVLAIIGMLGSLVALFYYLYLIKIMIVDPESNAVKQIDSENSNSLGLSVGAGLSFAFLIGFGIFGMDIFRQIANDVVIGLL